MCSFEGIILSEYSSLAQSVEHSAVNRVVVGSSPTGGVFIWLLGQAVKTSPFHGGNTGSIPVGVTKNHRNILVVQNLIWRHGQVVRQRSATPLSPVQIWLAPLKNSEVWTSEFFICLKKLYSMI